MQIIETFKDGSREILLEVGDRVRFTRDGDSALHWAPIGAKGTVVRRDYSEKHPTIAFLWVQTDAMKRGGYGSLHVPPWYLEPIEIGWTGARLT